MTGANIFGISEAKVIFSIRSGKTEQFFCFFNRDKKDLLLQELLDYCFNLDRVYKHYYDVAMWHDYEKGIQDTKSYSVMGRKGKCKPKTANEVIRNNFLFVLIFCRYRKKNAVFLDYVETMNHWDELSVIECVSGRPLCGTMEVISNLSTLIGVSVIPYHCH